MPSLGLSLCLSGGEASPWARSLSRPRRWSPPLDSLSLSPAVEPPLGLGLVKVLGLEVDLGLAVAGGLVLAHFLDSGSRRT